MLFFNFMFNLFFLVLCILIQLSVCVDFLQFFKCYEILIWGDKNNNKLCFRVLYLVFYLSYRINSFRLEFGFFKLYCFKVVVFFFFSEEQILFLIWTWDFYGLKKKIISKISKLLFNVYFGMSQGNLIWFGMNLRKFNFRRVILDCFLEKLKYVGYGFLFLVLFFWCFDILRIFVFLMYRV